MVCFFVDVVFFSASQRWVSWGSTWNLSGVWQTLLCLLNSHVSVPLGLAVLLLVRIDNLI